MIREIVLVACLGVIFVSCGWVNGAESFCQSTEFREAFLADQEHIGDTPFLSLRLRRLGDEAVPCLALVAEGDAQGFHCSPPSLANACQYWAVDALGGMTSQVAEDELVGVINDGNLSPPVMKHAIYSLLKGGVTEPAAAIEAIRKGLDHPSPTVRASAIEVLSVLGATERLEDMVASMKSLPDEELFTAAVAMYVLRSDWVTKEIVKRVAQVEDRKTRELIQDTMASYEFPGAPATD